ncbi:hypothetical protein Desru_3218 [Desulforamulus ruminis DSM 2154]|uniref:Uncharacterized protein n=1 Tax=Desulforamulus ruminis (strain ATCC 23193 / DSM 2154 / NCIMB 8452 / DL) TaxID=696281 RepID=F6DVG4_DESRL|nr:hypothetical protein Desru_3218 [Desulforamulus ruminis DSM 2154]
MAIPLGSVMLWYMRLKGINTLDLGSLLNKVIYYQTKELFIHSMAGVWFGKVIIDCLNNNDDKSA